MNLQEYLATHNLTQAEFARRVGITDQTVCDFLAGRKAFSDETALKIERATDGEIQFVDVKHPDVVPKFYKASNDV